MYRILIVEDDSTIASNVAAHLERWDYETRQIEDFKCVMEAFQQFDPQLVILDIGLPFYNGFYWCQEIRKISSVPILFLSSMNDNMNIVMAMNMGGDEFIEKPFDLNVLTAKVQALLRRAYSFQGNVNVLEHEGMLLNLNDASLSYRGEKISLTKNEFRILQMLMENAGKIVARDDIIARLWESDEFIDDNTLTVNVARLRKKLENADMEAKDISGLKTKIENYYGKDIYDIEFYADNKEYNYNVDMYGGEILAMDFVFDKKYYAKLSGKPIDEAGAIELVKAQIPNCTTGDINLKLEHDDDYLQYEGRAQVNGVLYEITIDKNTGTFVEWKWKNHK